MYRFARKCGGQPFCYEIGEDFPGVRDHETFLLIERAYLNTSTDRCTAPHESSVVQPIAVAIGTSLDVSSSPVMVLN